MYTDFLFKDFLEAYKETFTFPNYENIN
jgi:hypothetical protein